MYRLIAQAKCSPVDDQQLFGIQLFKGLHRFAGIQMALCHKPTRLVGAHVENGQVDIKFLSQLLETVKIGGVAGTIDGVTAGGPD